MKHEKYKQSNGARISLGESLEAVEFDSPKSSSRRASKVNVGCKRSALTLHSMPRRSMRR